LESAALRKKFELDGEDVAQIVKWIDQLGVRWGIDSCHRNEVLLQNHCSQAMPDGSGGGTWQHALTRLLYGLSMDKSGALESLAPIETSPAQTALLEKWMRLLKSLQVDLKPLADGSELTLSD